MPEPKENNIPYNEEDERALIEIQKPKFLNPADALIDTLAEIEAKLKLQNIKNIEKSKSIDRVWLELLESKRKYMELLLKYGKGTTKHIIYENKNSKEGFKVINPEVKK